MAGAYDATWRRWLYSLKGIHPPSGKECLGNLRACIAELKVEGILYALIHEKDLSYGSLRRRVDLLENLPSGLQATARVSSTSFRFTHCGSESVMGLAQPPIQAPLSEVVVDRRFAREDTLAGAFARRNRSAEGRRQRLRCAEPATWADARVSRQTRAAALVGPTRHRRGRRDKGGGYGA